nr:MAG TPA: hypothetical protein [Caudoviricetes sp.]
MSKEGYSDPTAEIAVANVMREYRRKKQAGGNIWQEVRTKRQKKPESCIREE